VIHCFRAETKDKPRRADGHNGAIIRLFPLSDRSPLDAFPSVCLPAIQLFALLDDLHSGGQSYSTICDRISNFNYNANTL
jgi:hypothetical protein